jgi:hypothetical protein
MSETVFTIDVAGTLLDGLVVKVHESGDEWHWTAWAKNHKKVGTTGETYENREYAAQAASELFPTARVEFEDGTPFTVETK